jgi:hypothetical protein
MKIPVFVQAAVLASAALAANPAPRLTQAEAETAVTAVLPALYLRTPITSCTWSVGASGT